MVQFQNFKKWVTAADLLYHVMAYLFYMYLENLENLENSPHMNVTKYETIGVK